MYEIQEETDRFFILRFEGSPTHDEVEAATGRVRELEREKAEPLLLLTDLSACDDFGAAASSELGFVMRLNDRGVKAHVLVVEEGSDTATAVRGLVDDDDEARTVVTDLNDAYRALARHFGAAEELAFGDYFAAHG